jgi:eukaryotic-like serine/threonine-protein kinase
MSLLGEGQIIRGTHRVDRFVGEGAFAEVYRVDHSIMGRQAMKVLKAKGATLHAIEEALGEAVLLSRIGHPNIIRVFDANIIETPEGQHGFFTMEYVAGGSLEGLWRSYRDKLMPLEEAVEVLKQVCSGIAVAHAETPPIVHRDIKPQNILVGYDGNGMRVRVSDFGLAKRANPLTLLVSARGTLQFKPPEAFENQDSPAADVWALGVTLYQLLTDTLPFPGLDGRGITDASRFVRPLRPASLFNLSVDPALDAIVARCLAKNPNDRYPNAAALSADLHRWQPKQPDPKSPLKSQAPFFSTKSFVGVHSPGDLAETHKMIERAMTLAKHPKSLMSAADLLEEAINRAPQLRDRYDSQIKLWRRGVCM